MTRDPLKKQRKGLTPLAGASAMPAGQEPINRMMREAKAPKRDRSWERRMAPLTVTYRPVPAEVQAAVNEIAREKMVRAGEVASRLLEYAIAQYKAGKVRLEPELRQARYTLYPDL